MEPDLMVDAAYQLTPEVLKRHEIQAVMVDLDETLVASGSSQLKQSFYGWIVSLKKADVPVLILSNGTHERVDHWSKELKVSGYALSGKPFFGFGKALKELGTPPAHTAMIGDQLFTDILGAKLAGIKSIWVEPLSTGGLVHTQLLRKLERFLKKRFVGKEIS